MDYYLFNPQNRVKIQQSTQPEKTPIRSFIKQSLALFFFIGLSLWTVTQLTPIAQIHFSGSTTSGQYINHMCNGRICHLTYSYVVNDVRYTETGLNTGINSNSEPFTVYYYINDPRISHVGPVPTAQILFFTALLIFNFLIFLLLIVSFVIMLKDRRKPQPLIVSGMLLTSKAEPIRTGTIWRITYQFQSPQTHEMIHQSYAFTVSNRDYPPENAPLAILYWSDRVNYPL